MREKMPHSHHSPQPHSGERRNPDEFSGHSYIQSWNKQFRSLAEDTAALQRMELVFGFFSAFSRAEFALKKCGYLEKEKEEKVFSTKPCSRPECGHLEKGKEEKVTKKKEKAKEAKADWKCFSKTIESSLKKAQSHDQTLERAIQYITDQTTAPKKQLVEGQSVTFEKIATKADSNYPLTYVCRIRNNLFHGGKTINGPMIEERDEKLLIYGIIVLLACINCDDAVRNAYLETEGGPILFPLPNPPPQAGEGILSEASS